MKICFHIKWHISFLAIHLATLTLGASNFPNSESLRIMLNATIAPYNAKIGISVLHLENFDTLTINNSHHYPMLSVYKYHQALAVLHEVDLHHLSLNQLVYISKRDLKPRTWSPLREKYPEGKIALSIAELLQYSVSLSDNNACDILFRLMNGTRAVEKYMRSIGRADVAIVANENRMHKSPKTMYSNWTTPSSSTALLEQFYHHKILSDSSHAFLMNLMTESSNSRNRIKGLLPDGTIVAHKTGSSGHNTTGISAATNDIGIITLPDGQHIALSIFVSDSKENDETNEKIIAEISKIIFDFYSPQNSISIHYMDCYDASRDRKINLIYYLGAENKNNHKVVIISHGYGGSPDHYSFIAKKLAAEGYLVVSVGHELPTDSALPMTGDLYTLRMPIWQRGVQNILFVCNNLQKRFPSYNFSQLTLIGHSNGGDISVLMGKLNPEKVEVIITLDHRRMPIPRVKTPRLMSIRANDLNADDGVLPPIEEQKKYEIQIYQLGNNALHSELCDNAGEALRNEILIAIIEFLKLP